MFENDIGIDLGTANTLVYKRGKGIILREPSVVAVNTTTGKVVSVGNEAKEMIGRTPSNITTSRPLKDGVIADYESASKMLNYFLKKTSGKRPFSKTRMVLCYPVGVTEVEKMAIEDAAEEAGVKDITLIPEPFAAALGAGLPVFEPQGSMIVDIGGGTAEVAVLSLGGIVTSCSVRTAGDAFDNDIIVYVKKKHNVLIGERTAEAVKLNIGCAYEGAASGSIEVKGRDLISGLPATVSITSEDVKNALQDSLMKIIDSIKSSLEITPPELSADIIVNGITVSGGGAMLPGLGTLIESITGIHCNIAENPLDCVVIGTGRAFDHIQTLKNF